MNRTKHILKEKEVTQQELADSLYVSCSAIVETLAGKPVTRNPWKNSISLNIPMWQLFASPEEVQF